MPIRAKKLPSALKHGMYSATALLPTEDPVEFEKLHQDLITELAPNGALECDIVANIARLTWRKNNLPTLRHVTRKRQAFGPTSNLHIFTRSAKPMMPIVILKLQLQNH